MKRKRILMILDNEYRPDRRVAKEISVLNSLGFHVNLLCWDRVGELPQREETPGLEIRRLRILSGFQLGTKQIIYLLRFYLFAFFYILKNYINKSLSFDIIYVHDYLLLPLGTLLRIIFDKPLIYDAHELYFFESIKMPEFFRPIIRYSEIMLLQFVSRFITVSDIRAPFYKKYKKEIHIVGNWYNPISYTHKDIKKTRKILGLPLNKFIIGYFGVLTRPRALDILLRYGIKHPEDIILIGGKGGPYEEEVSELSKKYKNIIYLGWVKDIDKYMIAIDALFYVLRDDILYYKYSSPNNLFMAIAYAKPIITNNLGEQGEVIGGIDNSILMRSNTLKEMERVVSKFKDTRYNNFFTQELKKLQRIYNYDAIVAKYEEVLKGL